ncbi:MAG: 3'(2'),5'-bisphosphate nucleotidase CysQ [Gammaproteobacteria bacterium]|nr:3'(2'),5'-bisphosphate nucleotidase CysQ [Gammaproteobacteria bacterium]
MTETKLESLGPLELLGKKINQIAASAGKQILEIYNTDFSVEDKDDKSPLTAADMASHETIIAGLLGISEDIPVLSEESSSIDWEDRKQWNTYWLVDPLDGTREFIKKNGEFTVNIALIHEHRPVLGSVYVPATGVCYSGIRGAGAFREDQQGPVAIHTRKTREDRLAVAGSRSHGSEAQEAFMQRLGNAETMAIGSSLKFCLVAEGKVDIYPRFGPTSEWDTAAAHCVVEQAGGLVTDTQLDPLLYNNKESILNPHFLVIGDPEFDWRPYLKGLV